VESSVYKLFNSNRKNLDKVQVVACVCLFGDDGVVTCEI